MHSLPLRGIGSALLLCVLAIAAPSWADDPDVEASALLSPDAAVAAALQVHSQVLAAQTDLLVAHGLRSESFPLNNPQISARTTLDGARGGVDLSQPISLSGEGGHARRSATALVEAAEAWLSWTRLVAAAETRQAYVDAVVATGEVRVAQEGLELAARLRHAVTRQAEEGEASTLDVRLARLAEVQAASSLLDAREVEAEALRTLAESVGSALSSDQLVPDLVDVAPSPSQSSRDERSDITSASAALRSAQADVRRERAAALPAIGAGVFVDVEDGQTFTGPSLTVELPVFWRNQSGRAEALGDVLSADALVATRTARAHTERATAEHRVQEAEALSATLVVDPLLEAREALKSIEAGYLAGELDLPTTVLLQGEVLDGEAAAVALLGGVASARLDLLLATEDPALLGGAR